MSKWAIVAIPRQDDPVWKISSEKVPHMTIAFLGEQTSEELAKRIAEHVEHVAKNVIVRFGLSVDYRDELGEDKADVLFFDKDFVTSAIGDVRNYFLQNDEIRKAFDSVEQYPEWTPHLTLGYPESPAKPDERDYPGVHWVEFDRIALWTGDFEGPTFRLDEDDRYEMAHSDKVATLMHYGVPGMKWGRRRARDTGGADVARRQKSSSDSPSTKKPLTREQKATRAKLIAAVTTVALSQAVRAGARYAANNPDKLRTFVQRAQNMKNGTKAIGPGFDVVKLTLNAAGVYR